MIKVCTKVITSVSVSQPGVSNDTDPSAAAVGWSSTARKFHSLTTDITYILLLFHKLKLYNNHC